MIPPAKEWTPHYLQYCLEHGKTPEQMLAYDRERFPGGRMCGFLTWTPSDFPFNSDGATA